MRKQDILDNLKSYIKFYYFHNIIKDCVVYNIYFLIFSAKKYIIKL